MYRIYSGISGGNSYSRPMCYNGITYINVGSGSSSALNFAANVGVGSHGRMYDTNYDTQACWCGGAGGCPDQWAYFDCTTDRPAANIYEESVYWKSSPKNPWIQIGALNGTHNWNYSGLFIGDDGLTDSFASRMNNYLTGCTADDNGYCNIPVYLYSEIGGIIEITDIEINYSVGVVNPIVISSTAFNSYLSNSSGEVNVPITIESSRNGTLEVYNIKYDYRGGNDTITYLAHTTDYSSNLTRQSIYYYSDWTWSYPNNVYYMEFIPKKGPTQKNVTPYGQTTFRPILNFTSQAYGGKTFNFSVLINESFSCVNDTISLNNSKDAGNLLVADTYVNHTVAVSYESTFDMYAWADFACTYSTWYLWNPYWYLRACCTGCDICDNTVYNVVEM